MRELFVLRCSLDREVEPERNRELVKKKKRERERKTTYYMSTYSKTTADPALNTYNFA